MELPSQDLGASSSSDASDYAEAANRLLAASFSPDRHTATAADVQVVAAHLTRRLVRRGFSLSDAEDAVQDALAELALVGKSPPDDAAVEQSSSETSLSSESAELESPQPINNPAAFLYWLARNRAIDAVRKSRRIDPLPASSFLAFASADDTIAQLLDHSATAQAVAEATRIAVDAGDHLAVQVVGKWLRLARETGTAPSSRDLAPLVNASHTSVNLALRRFRTYLARVGADRK